MQTHSKHELNHRLYQCVCVCVYATFAIWFCLCKYDINSVFVCFCGEAPEGDLQGFSTDTDLIFHYQLNFAMLKPRHARQRGESVLTYCW